MAFPLLTILFCLGPLGTAAFAADLAQVQYAERTTESYARDQKGVGQLTMFNPTESDLTCSLTLNILRSDDQCQTTYEQINLQHRTPPLPAGQALAFPLQVIPEEAQARLCEITSTTVTSCEPFKTELAQYFEITLSDIEATDYFFLNPNLVSTWHSFKSAEQICRGKGYDSGFFNGHQLEVRRGLICFSTEHQFLVGDHEYSAMIKDDYKLTKSRRITFSQETPEDAYEIKMRIVSGPCAPYPQRSCPSPRRVFEYKFHETHAVIHYLGFKACQTRGFKGGILGIPLENNFRPIYCSNNFHKLEGYIFQLFDRNTEASAILGITGALAANSLNTFNNEAKELRLINQFNSDEIIATENENRADSMGKFHRMASFACEKQGFAAGIISTEKPGEAPIEVYCMR